MFTGLEKMILIPERRDAHEVMRQHPRNVDSAYTINAERVKVNANGGISHLYMGRNSNIAFFEDYDSQLKQNQNAYNQKAEQLAVCENDMARFYREKQRIDDECQASKRLLNEKQQQIMEINYEIRRFKTELQNLNPLNVSQLEIELEKEKEKLELLRNQFQVCFAKKKEMIDQAEVLKEEVEKIGEEIRALEEKEEEVERDSRSNYQKKIGLEKEIKRLEEEKTKLHSKLVMKEKELDEAMSVVEKYTENAKSLCPKVSVTMPIPEIEKKINILRTKLKERGEDHNSPEIYMEQLERLMEELEKMHRDSRLTKKLCEVIYLLYAGYARCSKSSTRKMGGFPDAHIKKIKYPFWLVYGFKRLFWVFRI